MDRISHSDGGSPPSATLPGPVRKADRPVKRRLSETSPADLDRAAQIGRFRYVDSFEALPCQRIETAHFTYETTQPGHGGRPVSQFPQPQHTLTVRPVSASARDYLESLGCSRITTRIAPDSLGDYVARLEGELAGYWGPALSSER